MRLLHCETLRLHDFLPDSRPRYAILSHVWEEEEEVTFDDIQDFARAAQKKGYRKIKSFCQQALRDGLEYAWVDTCCIDKSSSAELSEAINAMFQWYRDAEVCYASLFDVEEVQRQTPESCQFRDSKWFTRGWTLQELLAPRKLLFYSKRWDYLGSRQSLALQVSAVTRIRLQYLLGQDLKSASVAERMSWASLRQTTREEDRSYSLLGIFDISMPLLYGEGGTRAFLRLQEEIVKRNADQSIFMWGLSDEPLNMNSGCHSSIGLFLSSLLFAVLIAIHGPVSYDPHKDHPIQDGFLAASPDAFSNSSSIGPCHNPPRQSFAITNIGVSISIPVKVHLGEPSVRELAIFDCSSTHCHGYRFAIPMTYGGGKHYRAKDTIRAVPAYAVALPSPWSIPWITRNSILLEATPVNVRNRHENDAKENATCRYPVSVRTIPQDMVVKEIIQRTIQVRGPLVYEYHVVHLSAGYNISWLLVIQVTYSRSVGGTVTYDYSTAELKGGGSIDRIDISNVASTLSNSREKQVAVGIHQFQVNVRTFALTRHERGLVVDIEREPYWRNHLQWAQGWFLSKLRPYLDLNNDINWAICVAVVLFPAVAAGLIVHIPYIGPCILAAWKAVPVILKALCFCFFYLKGIAYGASVCYMHLAKHPVYQPAHLNVLEAIRTLVDEGVRKNARDFRSS